MLQIPMVMLVRDTKILAVVVNAGITVSIVSPENNGTSFLLGEEILFNATARDAANRDLSDYIDWSSNIDSVLRLDNSTFTDSSLSVGNHTITASVTWENLLIRDITKIAHNRNGGPSLANFDNFGFSVDGIGDLNGDGIHDIAVGEPGDESGGTNRGAVHIMFMNTDGTVDSRVKIVHNTNGGPSLSNYDQFGRSVAAIGDLNGDGIHEYSSRRTDSVCSR